MVHVVTKILVILFYCNQIIIRLQRLARWWHFSVSLRIHFTHLLKKASKIIMILIVLLLNVIIRATIFELLVWSCPVTGIRYLNISFHLHSNSTRQISILHYIWKTRSPKVRNLLHYLFILSSWVFSIITFTTPISLHILVFILQCKHTCLRKKLRDKREKKILVVCLNIIKLIIYIIYVKTELTKKVGRKIKEKYIQ